MRTVIGQKNKINLIQDNLKGSYRGGRQGKLSIVGIGPGDRNLLAPRAAKAIRESEVIVGYKTYINLLGGLAAGKEIISSGMRQEVERAGYAVRSAQAGRRVALVSSGDPGVYGMAGLVLELLGGEEKEKIKIDIIPGIIAATSCASLLGAPLAHDFAIISLSDLLTDLELIKKRVTLAAQGDFVIVFYNPQSKKRRKPLKEVRQILLKYKSPDTPVGIVRNAARKDEETLLTTLKDMLNAKNIDMVTTIIVGNSHTYKKGGYMVTPRGYNHKKI